MDTYDFNLYSPALSEIPRDRIMAWRGALAELHRAADPDLDTGPNTAMGDLHITPMGVTYAAMEETTNRLLSDLNPQNAANGRVWNCDFVRRYLATFGQPERRLLSWGVLRLTFNSDSPREIDASTRWQYGENFLTMILPQPGPLFLGALPEGLDTNRTHNLRPYSQVGVNLWAVDVLVASETTFTADGSATVDREIGGLTEARTIGGILPGTAPSSLQEVARRTISNFHPATPVTRGGARTAVTNNFPEIETVSVVLSGDAEMSREVNPHGLAGGALDVFVRRSSVTDTLRVRFTRLPHPNGLILAAELRSPQTVLRIVSVGGKAYRSVIFSDSPKVFGASRSARQRILLTLDPAGVPVSLVGDQFVADLDVEVEYDPALTAVQELFGQDRYRAAGLSILPRGFFPLVVEQMDVHYNRKGGVVFETEAARAEILRRFNSHTAENPAGAGTVAEALYWAGAPSVTDIQIRASLRLSPTTHYVEGGLTMPSTSAEWEALESRITPVPAAGLTTTLLAPAWSYPLPTLGGSTGPRNTSWLLESRNLRLIEQNVL
jgi:hypothetical protein